MFAKRDLKAFSAMPLLVHPTHYTGEVGYVSDTEDSVFASNASERASSRYERYLPFKPTSKKENVIK